MSLPDALSEANARIAQFLTQEHPVLDPLSQALGDVAEYLPIADPGVEQEQALLEYRHNLEKLQQGLERLASRLSSERTLVQSQRDRLAVALTYQHSCHL